MRPENFFKVFVVLLVLAVPLALAQKTGVDTAKYDPAKEIKLKGSVEEIKEVPGPKGEVGVELVLKTDTGLVEVRLCPNSFLKEFEVVFAKGDQLDITGAKIKIDDKDVVLAREIVRGNDTLVLRDKQGAPVWTWLKSS
jgi:hypothetical protein